MEHILFEPDLKNFFNLEEVLGLESLKDQAIETFTMHCILAGSG